MNAEKAIMTRRSIRNYTKKTIDTTTLKKIIDAGLAAPSACNRQGWFFRVLSSQEKIEICKKGAWFIKDSTEAILVCYDERSDNPEYEDNIISGSLAIENIVLMAWSMNIGCCIACHIPSRKWLKKHLNLPDKQTPLALVCMGYFDKIPSRPVKKAGYSVVRKSMARIVPTSVRRIMERKFEVNYEDDNKEFGRIE